MLNISNLPDLGEVKAQVDRIDNTVESIALQVSVMAEQVAAMKTQMDDIHLVFQGLAQVLPMGNPAANSLIIG